MGGQFGSMPVYESVHCTIREQFRFPISKKRRIREKWSKRERNYKTLPDPDMYLLQGKSWVGHPVTIQRVRELERLSEPAVSREPVV